MTDMKTINKKIILTGCLLLSAVMLFGAPKKPTRYVTSEKAEVTEKASGKAKSVATLSLGDSVTLLDDKSKKGWSQVSLDSDPSITGWVPSSLLSAKMKSADGKEVTADAKQIALAGKGFTEDIEKAYSEQFNVNFDEVDRIEKFGLSEEATLDFMEKGQLNWEEE